MIKKLKGQESQQETIMLDIQPQKPLGVVSFLHCLTIIMTIARLVSFLFFFHNVIVRVPFSPFDFDLIAGHLKSYIKSYKNFVTICTVEGEV